eukprot:3621172-Karenia_brevis.AAC.1
MSPDDNGIAESHIWNGNNLSTPVSRQHLPYNLLNCNIGLLDVGGRVLLTINGIVKTSYRCHELCTPTDVLSMAGALNLIPQPTILSVHDIHGGLFVVHIGSGGLLLECVSSLTACVVCGGAQSIDKHDEDDAMSYSHVDTASESEFENIFLNWSMLFDFRHG